jgi:hypothetical protein
MLKVAVERHPRDVSRRLRFPKMIGSFAFNAAMM